MGLVGDKVERCPKLKVIDVSGTLAEVSLVFAILRDNVHAHLSIGYPQNPQRRVCVVLIQQRSSLM